MKRRNFMATLAAIPFLPNPLKALERTALRLERTALRPNRPIHVSEGRYSLRDGRMVLESDADNFERRANASETIVGERFVLDRDVYVRPDASCTCISCYFDCQYEYTIHFGEGTYIGNAIVGGTRAPRMFES